ncbi:30S ribosomal protein S20, partial [Veillonella sp.]
EEAKQALVQATSVIDKAASKGVLHKNTAARKKSNLAAKVNAL